MEDSAGNGHGRDAVVNCAYMTEGLMVRSFVPARL